MANTDARSLGPLPPVRTPSRVVQLPESVLPETLEAAVVKCYLEYKAEPHELVIDLKGVTYIEISALSCIIAIARSRAQRGFRTAVAPPSYPHLLDILKLWRFFEALAVAVESPLESVIYRDLPLFAEPIRTFVGHPTGLAALRFNPSWQRGSQGQRNFFEFLSFPLSAVSSEALDNVSSAIPRREAERWQGRLIKSVLSRHLPGDRNDENDISRVLIFESIANAIQHPKAALLQVASRFYFAESPQERKKALLAAPKGHLSLMIWDDGESMVDTLKKAVLSGAPVRSVELPRSWYAKVGVRLKKWNDEPIKLDRDFLDQAVIPSRSFTELELLLSCLSPGVTRALAEPVSDVEELGDTPKTIGSNRGMGLFTLLRTVVDRYDGSLSFRTGRYFAHVRRATDHQQGHAVRVDYLAKCIQYPDRIYRPFLGNLLTIRIPILGAPPGEQTS